MKHLKFIILIFIVGVFVTESNAQPVWQSDMRVSMVQSQSGGYQVYEITVTTDNDDTSRSPHLIFTLPRNCKVRGVEFDGRLSDTAYNIYGNQSLASQDTSNRTDGYVKVDFANLNKLTTTFKISIESTRAKWVENDGASAYIFSNTPELKKKNNFVYLPLDR